MSYNSILERDAAIATLRAHEASLFGIIRYTQRQAGIELHLAAGPV